MCIKTKKRNIQIMFCVQTNSDKSIFHQLNSVLWKTSLLHPCRLTTKLQLYILSSAYTYYTLAAECFNRVSLSLSFSLDRVRPQLNVGDVTPTTTCPLSKRSDIPIAMECTILRIIFCEWTMIVARRPRKTLHY